MTAANHSWRKFKNGLMQAVTLACAILVIAPLVLLFYHLVKLGIGSVDWNFFTKLPKPVGETGGGMANAIVGTFVLLGIASFVGVPVGVLGGVYLSEYASSRLNAWIRFAADVLNGVPSIIWGMVVWGLMVAPLAAPFRGTVKSLDTAKRTVTVQGPSGGAREFKVEKGQLRSREGADVMIWYHRGTGGALVADSVSRAGMWGLFVAKIVELHNSVSGFSALAGGVALGMIMIPLIMRTTEEVLQLVPNGYREASLALGIAQWRTAVQIVARTALKGIVTGVLLALARVSGETAPLLFTALGNQFWSRHLTDPIAALPLQIFNYGLSPYEDWHRQAWAAALVLLLLITAINVSVRVLTRDRFQKNP